MFQTLLSLVKQKLLFYDSSSIHREREREREVLYILITQLNRYALKNKTKRKLKN